MEDIIIRVSKTDDHKFVAGIDGLPVSYEADSPFEAAGRLLRKINDVDEWLLNIELMEHPAFISKYLLNVKRFIEEFTTGQVMS
jgi:hypothetical protein